MRNLVLLTEQKQYCQPVEWEKEERQEADKPTTAISPHHPVFVDLCVGEGRQSVLRANRSSVLEEDGDLGDNDDDNDHQKGHPGQTSIDAAKNVPFVGSLSSTNETIVTVLSRDGWVQCSTNITRTTRSSGTSTPTRSATILWQTQLPKVESMPSNTFDSGQGWFRLYQADRQFVALHQSGMIASISRDNSDGNAEIVGELEYGILASAWNAIDEVLLVVTTTPLDTEGRSVNAIPLVVVALNMDWQVLAEVVLQDAWHDPTQPIHLALRPSDASLCALSCFDPYDQTRKIHIWDTETFSPQHHVLGRTEDGSGRLVPNLMASAPLAWAGRGCSQLLTTIQKQPPARKGTPHGSSKKTSPLLVAFLESNGLRHGEFALHVDDAVSAGGATASATSPLNGTTTSTTANINNTNTCIDGSNHELLVTAIEWNSESDLLAISWRRSGNDTEPSPSSLSFASSDSSHHTVQLWHRSNYHWYLKRQWAMSSPVTRILFHSDKPYVLYCLTSDSWVEYEWAWQSSTVAPTLEPLAYVVDGPILHLTPLHRAIIPPPMSAATLELPIPVNEVVCSPNDAITRGIVLLADGSLALLSGHSSIEQSHRNAWVAPTILGITPVLSSIAGSILTDGGTLRHAVIVNVEHQAMRLIGAVHVLGSEHLVLLNLTWNLNDLISTDNELELSVQEIFPIEAPILNISLWADGSMGTIIELETGQMLEFQCEEDGASSLSPAQGESLLEPCPWIAAFKHPFLRGEYDGERLPPARVVLGMTRRGRLYCHDVLLADSISSFQLCYAQQFLVYITAESRCQMRFLHLSHLANIDPLMGSDENHLLLQGHERCVERGARLVCILPEQPLAVVQMPRGNLESIYPRALVLRYVMINIMNCNYHEAFELMRRQKVDLNLIVDIHPVSFLKEGIHSFLDQVNNENYLNLFVSSLQNSDSTIVRYPIPSWISIPSREPRQTDFNFDTKVNAVCQVLRAAMIELGNSRRTPSGIAIPDGYFILPILSTFAKEQPPKLEDALMLIKRHVMGLNDAQTTTTAKTILFSDKAQSLIQYLAFLAEYEQLFDRALGLYDFDLARAVARNSQMDPKVYLPMLKRYRELPHFYSRYEVDLRLHRHDSALHHLAQSYLRGERLDAIMIKSSAEESRVGNSFDDCINMIEKYELHRLGLELFQDDKSQKQRILISLGKVLLKQGKAQTALSIFLVAEDNDHAMEAALACMDWRTYLSLSNTNRNSEINQADVSSPRLVADVMTARAAATESLEMRSRYYECAARVLLDYCNDSRGCVDVLLMAGRWKEANRIAMLHSIDAYTCIHAAIVEAEKVILDLEKRWESYTETTERYDEILKMYKSNMAKAAPTFKDDDDDARTTGSLFSAASTTVSSRSTGTVGSFSSVITAKSTTSFSLSGADEQNRHKSKYNILGQRSKSKKKKKE